MKNLYRMLVGLMALTVLSSASGCRTFSNQTSQEVPSEAKAKKNYYVAPFEAIEVNGVVNVSFSQSDKTDVEVIVTACRTKFGTVDAIKDFAREHGYNVIWTSLYHGVNTENIRTPKLSDSVDLNEIFAENITNLIKKLLS